MAQSRPRRWGLLVGIDAYPHLKKSEQLGGCVNDVLAMRELLTTRFSFPNERVELLSNGEATRERILRSLDRLTERVGEGDVVVFHYSGHGSRIWDREGDEADGFDETIVPSDAVRDGGSLLDISDDELYVWLKGLTSKAGHVAVILDCCHSGSALRLANAVRRRQIRKPLPGACEIPPSPIPREIVAELRAGNSAGSGWMPLNPNYVLLAGCSYQQSSNEKDFGGVVHGALSYCVLQELARIDSGVSYRDLFERVAAHLKVHFPNQEPQLEGDGDRELFGLADLAPMPFLPVTERSGNVVKLGAGLASGVTKGSEWLVYPAGTKEALGEPLGTIRITGVSAVESTAEVIKTSARPISCGNRAVEHLHQFMGRQLTVAVGGSPREVKVIEGMVQGSPLLRLAEQGQPPDLTLHLEAADVRGTPRSERWEIFGADGEMLLAASPRRETRGGDEVLKDLEKWARFRRALDLRNQGDALGRFLELSLLRGVGGTWERLGEDGEPILYEGDEVEFEICHTFDQELFVYLLDFGLTGGVSLLYPGCGEAKPLASKVPVRVRGWSPMGGKPFQLTVPEDLPEGRGRSGDLGRETVKLFASTKAASFEPLFQSAVWRGGPARSLDDALKLAFGEGKGQLVFRSPNGTEGDARWTTIERSFRVRRRPASA